MIAVLMVECRICHFRRILAAALLLLFPLFSPAQSLEAGHRYALVFGNSGYRDVETLPNTANDASDIAQKLSTLGYSVDLHLNADLPGMTRAISAWIRQLSADRSSEGFFWYAGHGVQVSGENYLFVKIGGRRIFKPAKRAHILMGTLLGKDPEELERDNITFYSGRHFYKTMLNFYNLGDIEELFMGHKVNKKVSERYNHKDKRGEKELLKEAQKVIEIIDKSLF